MFLVMFFETAVWINPIFTFFVFIFGGFSFRISLAPCFQVIYLMRVLKFVNPNQRFHTALFQCVLHRFFEETIY